MMWGEQMHSSGERRQGSSPAQITQPFYFLENSGEDRSSPSG